MGTDETSGTGSITEPARPAEPIPPFCQAPPPGRRERKRRSTRAAIVDAAIELFETNGYNGTSIDDITERADVARRTFFRHFAGKDAVLLPDFADYVAAISSRLTRSPAPLTLAAVFDACVDAAPVIDAKATMMIRSSAIIAANRVDVSRSAWRRLDSARVELAGMIAGIGGLAADDERVTVAATLVMHVIQSAVTEWITTTPQLPIGDVLRRYVDVTAGLIDGGLTLAGPVSGGQSASGR
ncbi:MAG: TetR/AcrR family transcriptional regulator [Acidimicrobiales bacterium]